MHLPWNIKLKIAASVAVGVVLLGLPGRWLAAPYDPAMPVSMAAGYVGYGNGMLLAILAFAAGYTACALTGHHGLIIGPLAVPAGLIVLAVGSGSVAALMQQAAGIEQRQAFFAMARWEAFFWLGLVAAGHAGLLLCDRLTGSSSKAAPIQQHNATTAGKPHKAVAVTAVATAIALFCIRLLAQDVSVTDGAMGVLTGQPPAKQIAFAVTVAFGLVAFGLKRLFGAGYTWVMAASALASCLAMSLGTGDETLGRLAVQWPAVFFPSATMAVLPLQMVAFGTAGALAGYWLAVRHSHS